MSEERILVVDDEKLMREYLKELLEPEYRVDTAASALDALKMLRDEVYDLVITDLRMPKMDGIELLKHVNDISPGTQVIVLTAYGSVESAVEAMKLGAYDYIGKPIQSPDEMELKIRRAIERGKLIRENLYLRRELEKKLKYDIVGKSPKMQEVFEKIAAVAKSDITVLITGETGTGKELVARAIHENSHRKDGMFVPVNCGAIPENLLESELFGHEKGAFTGAYRREIGSFEMANGGTIFLDEIGEMSPHLQVKLLRVLQNGEFQRVGSPKVLKTDARVIAATNADLQKAVEEGRFRQDLYYRLNVVNIKLPPLRERREDIPLLVHHFLNKYGPDKEVAPETMKMLLSYDWPGNVRELENVIESGCVLSKTNLITPDDLPDYLREASKRKHRLPSDGDMSLAAVEREHIKYVLDQNGWNITRSAEILGIDRVTLYNKIKKYGLKKQSG